MTDHHVIAEAAPGIHDRIQALAEACGGWCCEEHPDLPFPHDECPGPGMLRNDPSLSSQARAGGTNGNAAGP